MNMRAITQELVVVCLFALIINRGSAMLVKNWGTDNLNQRLAWATMDLFNSAVDLMNIGNPTSVMPLKGLSTNITLKDPLNQNRKSNIELKILRMFITDPSIISSDLMSKGNLRRISLTEAERSYRHMNASQHSGQDHIHEVSTCDSCIHLQFSGLHLGFQVVSDDPPLNYYGSAVYAGPIIYDMSFQLTVMTQKHPETNALECTFKYEPNILKLVQHPPNGLVKARNVVILADELDPIVNNLLNSTILKTLDSSLTESVRYVALRDDLCINYLSTGIFTPTTSVTREKN